MRFTVKTFIFGLLLATSHAAADLPDSHPTELEQLSLTQLETRLAEIDAEIDHLARFTFRSGVGNVGWVSKYRNHPNHSEWAEVELPENTQIDRIALVPALWNDAAKGPQADGFPESFDVIAGLRGDTNGQVVVRFDPDERLLPRVAPLVIRFPPTTASWVRIQSTRLSPCGRDGRYNFGLSEIMVFSGERNVALHQPVQVSSSVGGWGDSAIYKETLVDGLTPFLMDASIGKESNPYMAKSGAERPFSLIIDLEGSHPIDGVRFHSADVNEYTPQIFPTDFGMPIHIEMEGANQEDFSDAVHLLDYRRESVYQAGNTLAHWFAEANCRYVRLSVPSDAWSHNNENTEHYISFAEIEIFSNGRNVAMGKEVRPNHRGIRQYNMISITDGLNHYGAILSYSDWMDQLARRHDLEIERPVVFAELNRRYTQQTSALRRMSWLAALLAAGIAFTILIDRMLRLRTVMKLRERIAANLHDELSANLHGLVLLGDMARKNIGTPDKLGEVIDRIQHLSKQSRFAARHCTNMLQAETACEDLIKDMKYSASRMLADTQHELGFEGEDVLRRLPKRKRIDLFLFYKECLINIARHAEATSCSTRLTGTPSQTELIVTDNGLGVTDVPHSLKRRARLLRARVQIETPEGGGTRITLQFRPRRFGFKI